jgi:hypothetical protein
MEYTYRSSFRNEACTLILSESSIIVRSGKREYTIPYAAIRAVQIDKGREDVYKTHLFSEDNKTLVISNRIYNSHKNDEDQSRAYATFVRVLHFHLKDKSKAEFATGVRSTVIGATIAIAMLLSFSLSFVLSYMGIRPIDPFLGGLILAAFSGAAILASHASHWPRQYLPTDIPLDFLP